MAVLNENNVKHVEFWFGLKAEECYFIDDQPLNIRGAESCGMKGWVYDGDRKRLMEKLEEVLEG